MITGQSPFKGEYEQAVMYSIMNEEPEPITGIRTGVPMELERIVNKALAKRPEERYQHADEMLADLRSIRKEREFGESVRIRRPLRKISESKYRSRFIIMAASFVLLAAAVLILKTFFQKEPLLTGTMSVVVMPFDNQTGDANLDYLRAAIPNLLITNLEQSKYLSVLTWERMHDLLKQLGQDSIEIVNISRETGFELCKLDGVEEIVLGSFTQAGEIYATDVKVLDVSSKRLLNSSNAPGKGVGSIIENQIDALTKDISQAVVELPKVAETEQLQISKVTTTSMEAYNYFLKGKDEYEKFYFEDARRFLEKSILLDSTYAMAYYYLARANGMLGNFKARTQAFEKAKKFADKATEKERLYIEAGYARAVENNREKWFRILNQTKDAYPKEKLVYYFLADYYYNRGLFYEAIDAFNQALKLDPNYAEALNWIAYAYSKVNDYQKAFAALKRYASIHYGEANPFDSTAEIYFHQGKLDEAIDNFKKALDVKSTFGSTEGLFYILALKEKYAEALEWLDLFIEKSPSAGFKARGYWWKAFTSYWLGDSKGAMNDLLRSVELGNQVSNSGWEAQADWLRAWIYYDEGEFAKSRRWFKSYFDFIIENNPAKRNYFAAYHALYKGLLYLKQGQIDSTRARIDEINSLLSRIDSFQTVEITFYLTLLNAELLLKEDTPEEAIVICQQLAFLEFGMISEVVQSSIISRGERARREMIH